MSEQMDLLLFENDISAASEKTDGDVLAKATDEPAKAADVSLKAADVSAESGSEDAQPSNGGEANTADETSEKSDELSEKAVESDEAAVKAQVDNGESEISGDLIELYVSEAEQALAMRGASAFYMKWLDEAEALACEYPSFDIHAEAKSDEFIGLLTAGVSMKNAYIALHHDEILKKAVSDAVENAARATAEQVLKNVQANGFRPSENGISGRAAAVTKTDVNSLTGSDIRSILKQVSGGMKISF